MAHFQTSNDQQVEDNVCMGEVTGAHGIKGEVKVHSFTTAPQDLGKYPKLYDESGTAYKILQARHAKGSLLIIGFEGFDSRNHAEEAKGKKLYINKASLPNLQDDEVYFADLEGYKTYSLKNKFLGVVSRIHNYGASDIIEVTNNESAFMVPFIKDFVVEVKKDQKVLFIDDEGLDADI